jgi:UDP-N-acetyl-D-galactosamine dehydrogenase
VDPYYLAHKAQTVGYEPQVILSGRRVNDSMGVHVASTLMKLLISKNIPIKNSKVLILGITFKENCPDIRNTKIIDVINELKEFEVEVDVYDPNANHEDVESELGIKLLKNIEKFEFYDGIILAVAHKSFESFDIQSSTTQAVYDLKGMYPKENVDKRL